MSDSYQNSHGKPADLSNILQGDDSTHGLNSNLNNTTPSNFGMSGGQDDAINSDPLMDSRFSAYRNFPNVPTHLPGDPSFTRQTGPLMGGEHVNDSEEGIKSGDAISGSKFTNVDPRASKLEKRSEEPNSDTNIGLEPSQGKLKMD